MPDLRSYAVWDAGTRWFHWINAACVIALAGVGLVILNANDLGITNAGKVSLKTIHAWIGYAFGLNLLWRFAWASMGNPYARWRAILPGGKGYFSSLRNYFAAFVARTPLQYLGHNPAARLAIAVMFLLLFLQLVTGLVLASTDLFYPPGGHWIAQWVAGPDVAPGSLVPYAPELYDAQKFAAMRTIREPFALTHVYGFYVLLVLVVLHVAAVVVTEVREGGGLISAMFTGRKILRGRPADHDHRNDD